MAAAAPGVPAGASAPMVMREARSSIMQACMPSGFAERPASTFPDTGTRAPVVPGKAPSRLMDEWPVAALTCAAVVASSIFTATIATRRPDASSTDTRTASMPSAASAAAVRAAATPCAPPAPVAQAASAASPAAPAVDAARASTTLKRMRGFAWRKPGRSPSFLPLSDLAADIFPASAGPELRSHPSKFIKLLFLVSLESR